MDEELQYADRTGSARTADHIAELHQHAQRMECNLMQMQCEQQLCAPDLTPEMKRLMSCKLRDAQQLQKKQPPSVHALVGGSQPRGDERGGLKEEQGGNAYAASTSLEMPEWPIEDPVTEAGAPLQTQSVSHQEVLANLDAWKPSIQDELGSIFDVHGTLKRRTKAEVQEWEANGVKVEYIPGKGLFHRKGGTGRKNVGLWRAETSATKRAAKLVSIGSRCMPVASMPSRFEHNFVIAA